MIAFRDSTYGAVASVLDAAGSFTAFADAFPNGDGDRTRLEWPELFAGQAWQLPFRAYLARLRDKIILVDTGVGPPSDFLPSAQGLLPRAVDRDLVDLVVLTHLHIDHIGWALAGEQPYFRRARYVVAAADYEFFGDRLGAIAESGVLRIVAGECEVAPGLRFLSTPGHTPGHQSLLVRLPKTGAVVLSGDLVHFRDNFEARRAPSFNFNQEQSLQSIDKVAALLKAERGQLWINHDSAQSATIPHAPQYVQ
jgi:N-acyl homoserine lactone hydrolase